MCVWGGGGGVRGFNEVDYKCSPVGTMNVNELGGSRYSFFNFNSGFIKSF